MASLRLGVLLSGRGSNFLAIADAIHRGEVDAEIVCVVSNKPDAPGLASARERNLPAHAVDGRGIPRGAHEARVIELLEAAEVDLVVLAGYMRLLSPEFVKRYEGRMVNVHPGLLPAFKGLDAQRQAWEYGVRVAGCTTHFVTEDMDAGPVILQAALPVRPDDTAETLAQRILELEHVIYPRTIRLIAEGRVRLQGRRVVVEGATAEDLMIYRPEA